MRTAREIGDLWPRCKDCNHIAQSHNSDGCCERGMGQCKCCGQWSKDVRCSCKVYNGPTLEQFMNDNMTTEEIEHYGFSRLIKK